MTSSRQTNTRNRDSNYTKVKSRRFKVWQIALAVLATLMVAVFVAVPLVIQNRGLVVRLINQNAGLAPMRVDLAGISGGWFRPFKVQGLRLIDDRGAELVQIAEVETELTLVSLITNYRNLRTITVRNAEVHLDVQPGTTNIEEAIKPWLAQSTPASAAKPAASGPNMTGRIRIAEAIVHARDSVDLTAWDVKITEADVPLPTAEQPIPPMTLVGVLAQTAVPPGEAPAWGQFTLRTQPIASEANIGSSAPALRMNVATTGMPLHWLSLVKRRLPELPIDRVVGQATVQADVEYTGSNAMMAVVQTAQIDHLQLVAPALLGERGAAMQQIRLSGDFNLFQNRISTRGAKLDCDVGSLFAKADIAMPSTLPSIARPWLEDSDIDIQGTLDLPRLANVAPDLIKMQDQVQLQSGSATLSVMQKRSRRSDDANGLAASLPAPPTCNYQLSLGNLAANMQGRLIRWDQALQASVDVLGNQNGLPSFKVDCNSEFCQVAGSGDLQDGRITAQMDLDKLEQRLSQWFVLPLESLSGSAQASVAWKLDEGSRLAANGSLRTTPVRIVHRNGRLDEPAWDGEFSTVARVDGGSVLQLDRGQLSLRSAEESLTVQVLEPVSLTTSDPNLGPAAPAGLNVKLVGELDKWQRRGQLIAAIDPGVQVSGKCVLEATGGIDANHLEITRVDWTTEPFRVTTQGMTLQEARMLGRFAGRVDTQNIARLKVDDLLVQSESFALQAQDAVAANNPSAREGKAAFRIDPSRMMSSMQTAPSAPGAAASTPVLVQGDVTGQVAWTVDPQQVVWKLVSDAVNLKISQPGPQRPTAQLVSTGATAANNDSVLWEEPQVRLSVDGQYEISNGKLSLPSLQLQTEWLAYGGRAAMAQDASGTQFNSEGQVTYDAATVAYRLRNYTGGMVAVEGQRTEPLNVSWKSSTSGSFADALQAKSSLGWDRANVIGIDIGKADVPVEIIDGKFASKASFPVSQGTLRWDLQGDLTSDPILIRQAPQRVIENVAITRQMCQGWLKYVAPLLADVTSIQGNLTLDIDRAEITPTDLTKQTVAGKLHVHGAAVGPGPLADQLLGLVQQVRNLRRGAGASDGGGQPTSWLQLPEQNIGFAVEQGRVMHRDMQIQAGDVLITTSGSVGVDGSLELFASVPIQKDWVDKTPALQSLAGQQIQIPIRGTIQRPQLDMSSFASIGQQLATSALQGAAQKQIDRGLNKLLGPLSNQLAPIQQGMQQGVQQMQQGVQQNLPQLPLPNLGIPGFGGGAPAVPATAAPGAAAPGAAVPGLPSGVPQPPATTGPPNLPG
ncbi:MAG: hypothetical protein ACK5OB_17260 [Pirellula sp.]